TAKPHSPGSCSRSTAVMTLPESGSMRMACASPSIPASTAIHTCSPSLANHPYIGTTSPTLFVAASIRTTEPMLLTPTQTLPLGPAVMTCAPAGSGELIGMVATPLLVGDYMLVTEPL